MCFPWTTKTHSTQNNKPIPAQKIVWNKFSSPTKVSKRAGLEQSFLTAGFRVCVKNVGVGKIENKKPSPFCDLSIEAGLRRPAALDRASLVSRRRPPRAVRSELHSC